MQVFGTHSPHPQLAWQQLVSSGEQGVSHVWPSHLPGLARSVEMWDRRSDGPIVEWHAYSLPSPFPRQINLPSTVPQKTPHDFHERVYLCIRLSASAELIKIQLDDQQISHLPHIWLFMSRGIRRFSWKCTISKRTLMASCTVYFIHIFHILYLFVCNCLSGAVIQ